MSASTQLSDSQRTTIGKAFRVLRILIVLGLLAVLFWIVPVADVIEMLAATNPSLLLLGLLFTVPVIFLEAVQLYILSTVQALRLSLGRILVINLTLRFYNLFIPGSGSAVRWYKMSQPTGKKVRSLGVLAFNRLLTTFFTITVGMGFWILSQSAGLRAGIVTYLLFVVVLALAWLILVRFGEPVALRLRGLGDEDRTNSLAANLLFRFLVEKTGILVDSLRAFRHLSATNILLLFLIGIGRQLVGVVVFFLLARSVAIDISYLDIGWVRGVVALATVLPLSIAGGLGIREASMVALLHTLGVSPERALAYSLLILGQNILLGLVGGMLEAAESMQSARLSRQA